MDIFNELCVNKRSYACRWYFVGCNLGVMGVVLIRLGCPSWLAEVLWGCSGAAQDWGARIGVGVSLWMSSLVMRLGLL